MSTTPNEYPFGTQVRCSVVFRNAAGDEADPTTVTFRVRDPEGTTIVYVYNTDPELVRSAAGRFYVLVTADNTRTWIYRFEGTGAVVAADEKTFHVEESAF
ncbi:MAG TPA: hypothetical protein VJL58_04195 [Pyrinomonadaceae bacterium]|nr:hypothetical protein [Pyrinomonadaceae bacterium]